MGARGMIRRLLIILVSVALLAAAIIGGLWYGARWMTKPADPVTIAAASLQAVREQNRLVPFAARFVAVVTSTQSRFGFSAKKTLIMPGMVRYEIDLAALQQDDLNWNAATNTLAITLPAVQIAGPEVDLKNIREYGEGGVLMALTNTEAELDTANRNAGQAELLRQAREPLPMKLARDAARNAIERSFVMPLRAAGIDAKVTARFEGES